ncbi:MAG: LamG-like jellyroll fold domain-containing protein, partial [Planctomycetota bacterium]
MTPHRAPHAYRPNARPRRNQRGTAYLLAIIAVAVATVIGIGFLRSANTSLAVATNVRTQPAARGLAETGMAIALRHVEEDANWRSGKASGVWLSDVAWQDGTFAVRYTDEDDGDLADSTLDDVTVEVVGRVDGISHRLAANVAFSVPETISVLFVTSEVPAVDLDSYRIEMLESWGMAVTTIDDDAKDGVFDAAVAAHDVVFVASSVTASKAEALLDNTATGVVLEEGLMQDFVGLSAGNAVVSSRRTIYLADNLHPIVRGMSLGSLNVLDRNDSLYLNQTSIAGNARILGTSSSTGATPVAGSTPLFDTSTSPSLYAFEAGKTDIAGRTVHGRRVTIPLAANTVDVYDYSDAGAEIVRRSIEWAAGGTTPRGHVAAWGFDETAGTALYCGIDDHHGKLKGSPALDQPGAIDRAIDFDGSNDVVEVQDRTQLSPADAISISLWVHADAWSNNDHLISKGNSDQYRLWINSDGDLEFWLKGVGSIAGRAPAAGIWRHVAATYDGTEMRLYIAGTLRAS